MSPISFEDWRKLKTEKLDLRKEDSSFRIVDPSMEY